jgi:hypothetical protein
MVVIGNINTGSRSVGVFMVKGNNYTTGNLVVAGNLLADYWNVTRGLSVYGNLDVLGNFTIGANVTFANTTDAYSSETGSLHVAGGLSIKKNVVIGGNLIIYSDNVYESTTQSVNTTTGALVIKGGLGVAKNINVGETLKINKSLIVPQGTTGERPLLPQKGDFRYNTDYNEIEFYDKNNNWRSIINPQDLDRNTKIIINDQYDDNIIRFYTEGNQRMMMSNNANSGGIAIGQGFNSPRSTLDILGNLMISGNAYFNSGIIIGNTSNTTQTVPGTIRFTGVDLEGYINNKWISLAKDPSVLSFDSAQPFTTYQFHVSQVSQKFRYANRALGNPSEESNIFGHVYYFRYQTLNKTIKANRIEVSIDDNSANNATQSFDIEFYVNDVIQTTITVNNTQGNLIPSIIPITELIIYEGERISFRARANDIASTDAEIFITLHGSYTSSEINLSGNINLLFNNNINFTQNLTVSDNLNVLSNLNILGGAIKIGYVDDPMNGRIRYSGNDLEGCIDNKWVSLTRPQDSASFSAISPYRLEQFQFSKTETKYKYGTRALGTNNVFFQGSYYEFKYQKLRGAVQFKYVEVILDQKSIDNVNALDYTLIVEVNNITTKTISIPFSAGEYSNIISLGTTMATSPNDLISMKLKANNNYSVNLDLIITLLGDATLSNITLDANTNIIYNSNLTLNANLCVTGNAIFKNGITVGGNGQEIDGTLKYNFINNRFEGFSNGQWKEIGGSNQDIDKDTYIVTEQNSDDDIIRFYTQNNQRMMIGNTINSGFVGIGLGFNSPKSSLDIVGNMMVSGNAYFNSGVILSNINAVSANGSMRFQGTTFQGYISGEWRNFITEQPAYIQTTIPYITSIFEFRKTTQSYKYGNRSTGMDAADINEFGMAFIYKYERIHKNVTFDTIEIIQDDQSISNNDHTFTLQIEVNDVVQHTETFTFIKNEFKSKLINMSSSLTISAEDVISIKLKGDNANSIDADLLIHLIGTTKAETFSISGNVNFLMNNSITALEDFSVTKNFNALSNANFSGDLNIDGSIGLGITPAYKLHLGTNSAAKPGTNTWTISSDKRIKTNISSITKNELYDISKNFNVKKYKFKDTYRIAHNLEDRVRIGIIADDINEYMPSCINTTDIKYKIGHTPDNQNIYEEIPNCLNYDGSELQFVLFGCIPNLIKDYENIKQRLEALENNK